MQTVAEKLEAERQYESFIERFKSQLVEKTKDFEQIREKLIPHDIDQLRIKVQEELEIHHKQQLQALQQELGESNEFVYFIVDFNNKFYYFADQQRDVFFATKREFERNKAEYDTLIQNQQNEIVSIRADRLEVESALRQQLMDQQARTVEYVPSKDDKIRSQRSKIAELQHLVEATREEAKVCRSERDEVALELEKFRSRYEEDLIKLRASNHSAISEKLALEEKITHLSQEIEQKEMHLRNIRLSNDELSERADLAVKLQRDSERSLLAAREEYARQLEAAKAAYEADKTELQETLSFQTERLQEREELVRRTQREVFTSIYNICRNAYLFV